MRPGPKSPSRRLSSRIAAVCRNGFSLDLAELFLDDLGTLLPELRRQPGPLDRPQAVATAFHH
ncbi:hypothetical protein J7E86_28295 [Streptomyces sp. ISL-11]|nr:hypothetical protein [Streptomyces sp. ISL-11]MBT2387403.1 hypothetical protein [Streptomyces sp. ISL-11]